MQSRQAKFDALQQELEALSERIRETDDAEERSRLLQYLREKRNEIDHHVKEYLGGSSESGKQA